MTGSQSRESTTSSGTNSPAHVLSNPCAGPGEIGQVGAEQLSRGDMGGSEVLGEQAALGALAGAWHAEQDEFHKL